MQSSITKLAVIIPLAPNESVEKINTLVTLLQPWHKSLKLYLVGPEPTVQMCSEIATSWSVRINTSLPSSRAQSLNQAIEHCSEDFIWILHSDSRPATNAVPLLLSTITCYPKSEVCYYFPLRYYNGSILMRITELGVALRCLLFANPYGDQGFCINRQLINKLAATTPSGQYFDTDCQHGEDHIFILQAKQEGVVAQRISATSIATDARKYLRLGWLRTTWAHAKIWISQYAQYHLPRN